MEKSKLIKNLALKGGFGVATIALGFSLLAGFGHLDKNVLTPNAGFITAALCSLEADQASTAAASRNGEKLAVEIEQEGAALVKNEGILPLDKVENKKVNVFGHAVVDWLVSNSGSGSSGPGSSQKTVGLLEALEEQGYEYNEDIIDFYKSWCAPRSLPFSISSGYDSLYRLAEPGLTYTDGYRAKYDAAKSFSDTAIVVLSRVAGEHIDPPHRQINKYKAASSTDNTRGYLEISTEEEELLTAVGQDFDNVIVIINSSNIMSMSFMEKIPGLDACLIAGPTGTVGARAIPQILYGDINPSGRTADTWPMEHEYNPTYYTSGNWRDETGNYYSGIPSGANLKTSNGQGDNLPNLNFADYIEGIYVGYRWYETADAEGYWDEAPYNGYENVVAYPFGYGLSYTTFEWSINSALPANNDSINANQEITIQVDVKNTGDVAGRDVVEVYLEAPYYEGEIEKSSVKLVGFEKTPTIEPGETVTMPIKVQTSDFTSFDCYDKNDNGHAGYELDKGNYVLQLRTSAHTVKEGGNKVKLTYKVANTINVDEDNKTGNPVKPLFTGDTAVDGLACDGSNSDQNIEFFSRANFPALPTGLRAVRAWSSKLEVSKGTGSSAPNAYDKDMEYAWDDATVDAFGNPIDTSYEPTFGANNGLKVMDWESSSLTDLGRRLAADYDSEEWNDLLDQVTIAESEAIVGNSSSYNRPGVKSVGLGNGTSSDYKDVEAASQVGVDLDNKTKRLTAYPTPTVQAQCWNTAMPYQFGLSEAKDMAVGGADASYGPASNIHRTPYGGRSSEYHSEDGFLAGKTLASVTRGLSDGGKTGFIKHFAVNDTEYHRVGLYTWLTEQALREVYLRPFEEAVKNGEATALMTAFNRVGATWTGGSEALCQGVLRNEWGFKGMTITDMIENSTMMNIQMHFRAGNNYVLGGSNGNKVSTRSQSQYTNRLKQRLRENCKQVIYAHIRVLYRNELYNANPSSGEVIVVTQTKRPWEWWKVVVGVAEGAVIAGVFFGAFAIIYPNEELRKGIFGLIKKKEQ